MSNHTCGARMIEPLIQFKRSQYDAPKAAIVCVPNPNEPLWKNFELWCGEHAIVIRLIDGDLIEIDHVLEVDSPHSSLPHYIQPGNYIVLDSNRVLLFRDKQHMESIYGEESFCVGSLYNQPLPGFGLL